MSAADIGILAVLNLLNAVSVLLVAMSLPGTWLMVLFTGACAWWRWDQGLLGWPTLATITALAFLAEVLELVTGAVGAKKAGASTWGAVGAMAGAVVGGIAGTFYLPIIGSIIGAAAGAFAGALGCERLAGRELSEAAASGRGAFVGRLVGTALKLAAAVAMWIVVAFASVF